MKFLKKIILKFNCSRLYWRLPIFLLIFIIFQSKLNNFRIAHNENLESLHSKMATLKVKRKEFKGKRFKTNQLVPSSKVFAVKLYLLNKGKEQFDDFNIKEVSTLGQVKNNIYKLVITYSSKFNNSLNFIKLTSKLKYTFYITSISMRALTYPRVLTKLNGFFVFKN